MNSINARGNRSPLLSSASTALKLISRAIIAAGLGGIVLTAGCKESLMQKMDRAKQTAQDERRGIQQTDPESVSDYSDEWQSFRSEAAERLAANARTLDDLKPGVSNSDGIARSALETQIHALTNKNAELTERLDGYRDQGKLNWDAFKRDFSHDLDELSKAVKDMKPDNE